MTRAVRWTARTLWAAFLTASLALPGAAHGQATFDDASRGAAVAKAADLLRTHYIFPETGEQAARKIEGALAAGAYRELDARGFAERLTNDLYGVTKDKHMRVSGAGAPPPGPPGSRPAQPPVEAGFARADRLPGDIGYIELTGFPPAGAFRPVADRIMQLVGDTKGLIVDVRRNSGGSPAAVAYFVSFFLDGTKPKIVINDFFSRAPGKMDVTSRPSYSEKTPTTYHAKPVYVLTSAFTFSGGEEFAYDMQAFKLATLVGETTGGGANPGGVLSIGSGLGLFVPDGRPINPVTKTNWEGVGVVPDIAAPADDALKIALEKLDQEASANDIDALSLARLFKPRSTPTPGLEALARNIIEGEAKGEPAFSILAPGMAQAARDRPPGELTQIYAGLGPLQSLTFRGPGGRGGDSYLAKFANGSRLVSITVDANGKVSGFFIGPG